MLLSVAALAPSAARAAEADWVGAAARDSLAALGAERPRARPAPPSPLDGAMDGFDCSGGLVRLVDAPAPDARAVVLTNGHCLLSEAQQEVFVAGVPRAAAVALFDRRGRPVKARVERVLYASMTGSDIALVELRETYGELAARGVDARGLASAPARAGDAVVMQSGYFRAARSCAVAAVVPRLREDKGVTEDAYRLTCPGKPGTSGSPLISPETGLIVGVDNTGSDAGKRCVLDNPCEIAADGTISTRRGAEYGQRVDLIRTCVDAAGLFSIDRPGCALFRARRAASAER